MDELLFKPGDLVKHKASTFKMVIHFVVPDKHKTYSCSWYNENYESTHKGFYYEHFQEHLLEKYENKTSD